MTNLNVSASLATAYYSITTGWHNNGDSAYQGMYHASSATGTSRVGVMCFSGLGTTLKGAQIDSITLEPTIAGGSGGASRTLTFYSSNHQSIDTSLAGALYPNVKLGTLTGNGTAGTGIASTYNGKQKFELSSTNNSALFHALAERLAAGDTTFILYNGETTGTNTSGSGGKYSNNYLCFTAVSMSVVYETMYTVSYDANGHGTAPSAQSVDIGGSITLPEMSAEGYAFKGWAASAAATEGMTGSYTPTASITLYAVWKRLHTVTFDANGHGTAPEAQAAEEGDSITLPVPSAPGYRFVGWAEEPAATEGVSGEYTPTENVTLYAIWHLAYSLIGYKHGDVVYPRCIVRYKHEGTVYLCKVRYKHGGVLYDV